MVHTIVNKNFFVFSFFLLSLFIAGCERNKPHGENIASVNDAPISLMEFQKEVSMLSKRSSAFKITPQTLEEQLNIIIDKKLLLQEARRKGLTEDPRFVQTIKTFWEQTLIKELVESKTREWADRFFVTEEEVERHYQRMQYMPIVKFAKVKNLEQVQEIKEKILKGSPVEGEETIGPLFLEDVRSLALINAFDMDTGEVNVYEAEGGYIIIQVTSKTKTSVPSLKDSYSRIKDFLLEQKKQNAMEAWLRDVKNSAKIEINSKLLKGLANGQ